MSRRPIAALAVALIAWVSGMAADGGPAVSGEGEIRGTNVAGAIKDRYIVVFADDGEASRRVASAAYEYASRVGGTVSASYSAAVHGFTARMSESAARRLAVDPAVSYVEQDRTVSLAGTTVTGTQTDPPSWGLDRIDQRGLPLSGSYAHGGARNVTAYILDTGVRLTHRDFQGRARSGYDFVDNDRNASDCNGHGTHVAGTVGGATHGVAKDIKLVSVRVLDCSGRGSYSQIIAGVNWVAKNAVKPAVANMSLGGWASSALDTAVSNSIASGVTFTVAAGNAGSDACSWSPAGLPAAITVGATDRADARASFSNYGRCLDIFAPGVNIVAAAGGADTGLARMSGTSMAAPHVAGAAALVLAANPGATARQVRDALVAGATSGRVTSAGKGSPNALLYTGAAGSALALCGSFGSGRDRAIADRASVDSRTAVSGCTGRASAATTVRVSIRHTDRGDLAIYLVAPDGTSYRVKSPRPRDDAANVRTTYTVNVSKENRRGTWTLRIVDHHARHAGTLESWTITP